MSLGRWRGNENLLAGALLAVAVVAAYWEPLFSGHVLFPPVDGRPFYQPDTQARTLESHWGGTSEIMLGEYYGGGAFHPLRMLAVILPPLTYHLLGYVLDTVLVFVAAAYCLRGRGLRGVACYLPALGLAFSGYAFTLISAGHRGFFDMLPYAVFLFGFLDRAIERRSLLHYALAGATAAFGLASMTDVMLMFGMLATAYAVMRAVACWRACAGERRAFVLRTLTGIGVAAVFFGAFSPALIGAVTKVAAPIRQAQIGEDSTPERRWEFATNWSLPPEDILEFFAPCVFGIETADPRGPYWGRMGRTLGWEQHRQGLMNLRQHTVYLGMIQLLLAAYGIARVIGLRRRAGASPGSAASHPLQPLRADVWFWGGALIVTVMLSLGRFFPVYRLFYSLPYMSQIRCPGKFLHLTELCVCFLFAFGLAALLADAAGAGLPATESAGSGRKAPRTAAGRSPLVPALIVAGALALVFFSAASFAGTNVARLTAHWKDLGLGAYSDLLLQRMRGGLVHGGLLAGALAAVLALTVWGAGRRPVMRVAQAVLVLVVGLDLVLVGRLYVRTGDVSGFYQDNPVAALCKSESAAGRVSYPVAAVRSTANPLWQMFTCHGIFVVEPAPSYVVGPEYQEFFRAVGDNVFRLWQLSSTRLIIGPQQALRPLLGRAEFALRLLFAVDMSGRVYVLPQDQAREAVLEFRGGLPRAQLYRAWQSVTDEESLRLLGNPAWNPARSVLVNGAIGSQTNAVQPAGVLVKHRSRTRVELGTNSDGEGILLLTDKYDPGWRVRLDGKPAELLRCNYIMRGVRVPPGPHEVVFTYRPGLLQFALCLAAFGVLVAWTAVVGARRRGLGAGGCPPASGAAND